VTGPGASVATAADWPDVAALRTRVFVEEQGVPAEIERDDRDATAVHALSRDSAGRVVATGRLLVGEGTATIGRMAADAAVRGRGHGRAVLDELHRQAALRGVTEIALHAQLTARGFYERAGYTAVGEVYEEAGIAHVTMTRRLPDAGGADVTDRSAVRRHVLSDPRSRPSSVRGSTHRTVSSPPVARRTTRRPGTHDPEEHRRP
jgi:predicted GNAT family N-acyltransferase